MNVRVGEPAPSFTLEAYRRGSAEPVPVDLASYRGRWLVLFFYPADFTFVCPTELRAFAELADDFAAAGAELLAASTDSYHSHKAWLEGDAGLDEVHYAVAADTSHALSRDYGVLQADGTAMRGTFIIDPHGVLRHASVNDGGVGRAAGETLRTLQALQTGELCPADWRPGRPTLAMAA